MNLMNSVLQTYANVFLSGMSALQTIAIGTAFILACIDWACSYIFDLEQIEPVNLMIKKFVKYGMFIWFINQWPNFINVVVKSFVHAGNVATGGSFNEAIMKQPSQILDAAFNVIQPLVTYILHFTGWEVVFNIFNIAFISIAMLGTILAFGIMAIQIFVTYLEFYLASSLAIIFIPFGANKHTSFMAERGFGTVVSFGVKLMTLTAITSASIPLIINWSNPITGDPTLESSFVLMFTCLAMAFMSWQAPGLAAGLMSGSPTLTAGTAAGTALAAGATAVGGAKAAGALASAAGSVAKGAAKGAAGIAGAAAGGAAGKSGLQAAAGALGGMASHVGGGIKGAIQSSSTMQAASSVKDAFSGAAASASGGGKAGSGGSSSSSTSTGTGSVGSSGSTDTGGSSTAGSRGSPNSGSGSLTSASSVGAGNGAGGSDGFSADSKTGLLLPSSVANSRNFKPVENSTPPQSSGSGSSSSSSSGGASGVVASPKASTSNANSSSSSANQKDKPGVISSIAQLVNQGHSMIPPEASPSGGIHVPIKD
jgi:type IV secretion system protein TrbL